MKWFTRIEKRLNGVFFVLKGGEFKMTKRKKSVNKNSYDDAIWKHPKFLIVSLVVLVGVIFAVPKLTASAAVCESVTTVSKGVLSAAKVASTNEKILELKDTGLRVTKKFVLDKIPKYQQ